MRKPNDSIQCIQGGPEIKVGEMDISFTNASLFMIISTITILLIFNFGAKIQ